MKNVLFIIIYILSALILISPLLPTDEYFIAGLISLFIPALFILQAIGILYLLIYQQQKKYWMILLIMLSLFHLQKVVNINLFDFKNTTLSKNISIFTYNAAGKNFDEVKVLLSSTNKDIYCIQELSLLNTNEKLLDSIAGYSYYSGKNTEMGKLGLLIISKYPIIDTGRLEFAYNSFNRIIYSDVLIDKDTMRIYNVHFKSYNFKEAKTLNQYYKHLKTGIMARGYHSKLLLSHIMSSSFPIIVAGDFNELPYSYVIRNLTSVLKEVKKYSEIYPITYKKLPVRIDYIFTSSEYHCTNQELIDLNSSDHYAISTTLAF